MRFPRWAEAVGCEKRCLTGRGQETGRLAENTDRVKHMLNHVAAVNQIKRFIFKWHLFGVGTNQRHICKPGFIQPLAGQEKPAHGDIKTDDFHVVLKSSHLDHRPARAAAEVEHTLDVLEFFMIMNL